MSGWAPADFLSRGDVDLEVARVFLAAEPRLLPCRTGHYWHLAFGDWAMAKMDIEFALFTSASRSRHAEDHGLEASLIAYLVERVCRSAGCPAVEALAADSPVALLGSPGELAASWHTGGNWAPADVTSMTQGEPRSLFSL
jgi:hypothetical protein